MPLWAKIDVDMPTDGKLYGSPVVTRHLWTCLICLAKKQDAQGEIRGYDCALLAGKFNLPRRAVATALTHYQAHQMIELDVDGTIRLLNFEKRQGDVTTEEKRAGWRDRQQRRRGVSRVTGHAVTPNGHASRVEEEKEEEKDKEDPPSASASVGPSIAELESDWPPELLSRVREAITSTRKSGQMAEGPWRGFLLSAKQFSVPIRVEACEAYLDRALATEGKDERYLLGIMRGGRDRVQQRLSTNGARGAVLSISDEAKQEHEIPGRKRVGAS